MKIFKVSELNQTLKDFLEPTFCDIQVKGEVTNLKEQSSGHIYFSLKDEESQLSAVLFKGNSRFLKQPLKPGDEIVVRGELSVYSPRGSYQIIVREVIFSGIGDLLLKLHLLKEELKQKGYFEPARKKALPAFAKKIGVVTSPTGAVIQDIVNILSRRSYNFELILNPVKVQGDDAAQEIAMAIDQFNQLNNVDVIIVGRGGGSLEDLWPFNEKIVADAIFHSKIPIISAVGHETDFTICDYVADVRAPTPSAAAEIVVKESATLVGYLMESRKVLSRNMISLLKEHRAKLDRFIKHPLLQSPEAILYPKMQLIDDMAEGIDTSWLSLLQTYKLNIEHFRALHHKSTPLGLIQEYRKNMGKNTRLLTQITGQQFKQKKENLMKLRDHIGSINPKNLLQKGYCIPFRENSDSVIMSSHEAMQVKDISLLFHDGAITVNPKDAT
ncbi:MAG: exodeoxyribonuclease VII large subunit [Chlamydiales bacterium]|nr:exodeoxyribonuclease VII large subunit [Chlamydiales bacterium]